MGQELRKAEGFRVRLSWHPHSQRSKQAVEKVPEPAGDPCHVKVTPYDAPITSTTAGGVSSPGATNQAGNVVGWPQGLLCQPCVTPCTRSGCAEWEIVSGLKSFVLPAPWWSQGQ